MLLKVITPRLRQGLKVKVAGSTESLGGWNPVKAPEMTPGKALPLWTLEAPADVTADTEYKFIIVEDDSVRWEEGENRTPGHRGPLEFRGLKRWKGTGVSVPVFSLRSADDWGVGDFEDLKLLADKAAEAGMSVIQLLPVNDTTRSRSNSDSYPYNANSSYALHPLYLRPQLLGEVSDPAKRQEFEERRRALQSLPTVDYEAAVKLKEEYLRTIFEQSGRHTLLSDEFAAFMGQNYKWLLPWAAFSVLRDEHRTANFRTWGVDYSNALVASMLLRPESRLKMEYYFFQQYHLHKQLLDAAAYCRTRGLALKGDIPIGISPDSCDAWQQPELFNTGMQAGAPPDDFAKEGQNWGFPTYNWQRMAADGYRWWRSRLQKMAEYFDAFRIDHVLGFFRIWEIPRSEVYGLLGHFSPALPLSPDEMLQRYGFRFSPEMARPYRSTEGFASQRAALDAGREDLLPRFADRLFLPDEANPQLYHPRIAGYDTDMFASLSDEQQSAYRRLHEDFFYHHHNDLWRETALERLPAVTDATPMLACAEDLGMIPACVPQVLEQLQILPLEVQRMPKQWGVSLANPAEYPYLSVATTSTHDMPPYRLWRMETAGKDPDTQECESVMKLHVESPSMLTILPLQDWTACSSDMRRPDPENEQINVPANPNHYWCYRMHVTLEQLHF